MKNVAKRITVGAAIAVAAVLVPAAAYYAASARLAEPRDEQPSVPIIIHKGSDHSLFGSKPGETIAHKEKEEAELDDLPLLTIVTDGPPLDWSLLPHIRTHATTARSLFGWKPGETLNEDIARNKAEEGQSMPITQTEAQAVLLEFTQDYPGALELLYVFEKEAPPGVKGSYLPKERIHNGRSYPGVVYLPLGNIDDTADLLATLRHEVLGHYGINTLKPADKRALLSGIMFAREQPGIKDAWEKINRWYADRSMDEQAEKVWALYSETLEPAQHLGLSQTEVRERGEQSFMETCLDRVRPMQPDDLRNILYIVANGLHDRSRRQQNFPHVNQSF